LSWAAADGFFLSLKSVRTFSGDPAVMTDLNCARSAFVGQI
jgi:hypothetical protein